MHRLYQSDLLRGIFRGFPQTAEFAGARAMDLQRYHVDEAPPTIHYIPNFISAEEADSLWKQVYAAPKPKWTQLSSRRLQNWGGVPHTKGMMTEPLPKWLSDCCSKIASLEVFGDRTPNHVLVNEYSPGQGIMPHEDGPLYHPIVTTISLGSHTLLDFYKSISAAEGLVREQANRHADASYDSRYTFSLLLEPRSLLVLQNDMYTRYLHGIAQRRQDTVSELRVVNQSRLGQPLSDEGILDRSTRVSLTIRHVPKTFKIKLKLK